jgi:hypothetical protein
MFSDIYHNYESVLSHLQRHPVNNKTEVPYEGTRYPEAFPLPSIEVERIAQSLIQLFSRVGVARVILSEHGNNFTSTLLKQLYEMLGVKGIGTLTLSLFDVL